MFVNRKLKNSSDVERILKRVMVRGPLGAHRWKTVIYNKLLSVGRTCQVCDESEEWVAEARETWFTSRLIILEDQ